MEKKMYSVQIGDEIRQYEPGTTYRQIAAEHQKDYEDDIVLVFINDRLQELHKTLEGRFAWLRLLRATGHKTCQKRSMSLMLVKAVYDVANHDDIDKVRIHYSVSKGYYCTIEGTIRLDQEFLEHVEARMREMERCGYAGIHGSIHTDDAIALFFGQHGMA